jgi:deoxyribodipyrimidine photo-lyase
MKSCIVWFRNDLRLSDHPALAYAIAEGYSILPLYILDEHEDWNLGGASRWWLHHALEDLGAQIEAEGGKLHLTRAEHRVKEELLDLVETTGVDAVFWSRRYEAQHIACDSELKALLAEQGVEVKSFSASLLNEPFEIENLSGQPYRVFTPYWKKCKTLPLRPVYEVDLKSVHWLDSDEGQVLELLDLLPQIKWDAEFYQSWNPTRSGAEKLLRELLDSRAVAYDEQRDLLAEEGTSKMSPYLAFGQLSPVEIHAALDVQKAEAYIRQLYWRDFSYHLLYHFPQTDRKPLREEWELFPWSQDEEVIQRWQKGQTGYPVVDAAMRQLWETGWMHNRARMIAASVLVKHFQQDWMVGAQWFWDTLVDADLANNTMGWQWSAGCGADAAPYFRVFNPVTQGQKFDPKGAYVRKYVPELAKLPNKYLFNPWEAPKEILSAAGITLDENYPAPVLLPSEGRQIALDAYQKFKATLEA